MGYDLHITRREVWSDTGNDITAEERLAYVRCDSELQLQPLNGPYFAALRGAPGWLDWSDGCVYSKNPDTALIDKMVAISHQFAATVQGDDGEIYKGGGAASSSPTLSFGERVRHWFRRGARPASCDELPPLAFGVGDKVRDTWGNQHTVLSINHKANHGLGAIRTRRCSDGTILEHALRVHGLERTSGQ
jgi:hypothetical protein